VIKSLTTRFFFFAALTLLAVNAALIHAQRERLSWWYLTILPAAYFAADLLSGLVHWLADSFGRVDTAFGRRFILPFRLHHEDSQDIVRRPFFELNGDVAMGVTPLLLVAIWQGSADHSAAMLFQCVLTAVALAMLPTNQIHQWAHRENVPAAVAWLQRCRLILPQQRHRKHHTAPFASRYCITSGWCDRALETLIRRHRARRVGQE
jgi:ubiquitin-conjugating enzyme E2 variant